MQPMALSTYLERRALPLDPGSPEDLGVLPSLGGDEDPYLNGEESAEENRQAQSPEAKESGNLEMRLN